MSLASIVQSYLSDGDETEAICKDLHLCSETSNAGEEDNLLNLYTSPGSAEQVPQMEVDPDGMEGGKVGVAQPLDKDSDVASITPSSFLFNDDTLFDFGFAQAAPKDGVVAKLPEVIVEEIVGLVVNSNQKKIAPEPKSNGHAASAIVKSSLVTELTCKTNDIPAMRKREDMRKICDSLSASLRKPGPKPKLNSRGQRQQVTNCKSVFSLREDLRRLLGQSCREQVNYPENVNEEEGGSISNEFSSMVQNQGDDDKLGKEKTDKEADGGEDYCSPELSDLERMKGAAEEEQAVITEIYELGDSPVTTFNRVIEPNHPVDSEIQKDLDNLSPTAMIPLLEEVEEQNKMKTETQEEKADSNHEMMVDLDMNQPHKAALPVRVQQRPGGLRNSTWMRAYWRRKWNGQFRKFNQRPVLTAANPNVTSVPKTAERSAYGNTDSTKPNYDDDDLPLADQNEIGEAISEEFSSEDESSSPEYEVNELNDEDEDNSSVSSESAKEIEVIDLEETDDDDEDGGSHNVVEVNCSQLRADSEPRAADCDTVTVVGVKIGGEDQGDGEKEVADGGSEHEQAVVTEEGAGSLVSAVGGTDVDMAPLGFFNNASDVSTSFLQIVEPNPAHDMVANGGKAEVPVSISEDVNGGANKAIRKRKRSSRITHRNGVPPHPPNWMLNYILRRLIQRTKSTVNRRRELKLKQSRKQSANDRKESESITVKSISTAVTQNNEDVGCSNAAEKERTESSYKCPFCFHISPESTGLVEHLRIHKDLIPDPERAVPDDNPQNGDQETVDVEVSIPDNYNSKEKADSGSSSNSTSDEEGATQPQNGKAMPVQKQIRLPGVDNPFKCEQCPSSFKSTNNLQKHVICHDRSRPWKWECCQCKLYFVKQFGFRRHNMFVHKASNSNRSQRLVNPPIQNELKSPAALGRCSITLTRCDKVIYSGDKAAAASASTNNCAEEESDDDDLFVPAYSCKLCGNMFTKKALLAAHKADAHGKQFGYISKKISPQSSSVVVEEPPPPSDSLVGAEGTAETKRQSDFQSTITLVNTRSNKFYMDYDADDDSTMVNGGSVVGRFTRGRMSALLLNRSNPDTISHNVNEEDISADKVVGVTAKPKEKVATAGSSTKTNLIAPSKKENVKTPMTDTSRKCNVCKKSFASVHIKSVHMRIHSDEKPFKCDRCDCSFRQIANLQFHEKFHDPSRPFKCSYCSLYFEKQTSLTVHSRRMHKAEEAQERNKQNGTLTMAFDTGSIVSTVVQKEIHAPSVVELSSSQSPFSSEEDSEENEAEPEVNGNSQNIPELSEGENNAPTGSDDEGDSSSSEDNSEVDPIPPYLSPEKESHPVESDLERFSQESQSEGESLATVRTSCKCAVCGKLLANPEAKQDHMKIHMSGNQIKCGMCNRRFKQLVHLKLHEKFHNSARPFTCSRCNLFFETKRSLDIHVGRMHRRRKSFGVKIAKRKPWDVRPPLSFIKSAEVSNANSSRNIPCSSSVSRNNEEVSPRPGPSQRDELMSPGAKSNVSQLSMEATSIPGSTTSDDEVDYEVRVNKIADKKGSGKAVMEVEAMVEDSESGDANQPSIGNRQPPTQQMPEPDPPIQNESGPQKKRKKSYADLMRPFKCDKCSSSFARAGHLKVHKEFHDSTRPFKCPFCNMYYKKESARGIHVTVTHKGKNDGGGQDIKKPKPTPAESIKAKLTRSSPMIIPGTRVKVTPRFIEAKVTRTAIQESNGSSSSVLTKQGKPTSQTECEADVGGNDQNLRPNPNLSSPSGNQSEAVQFPCTHCNRSFNHPGTLRSHKRFHDPTRPWKCSRCDLFFDTKRSLVVHAGRMHKGEMRVQKETKSLEKVDPEKAKASSSFVPLLTSRRPPVQVSGSSHRKPPPLRYKGVPHVKNDVIQNQPLNDMWSDSLESLVLPPTTIDTPLTPETAVAGSSSTISTAHTDYKQRVKRKAGFNARLRTQSFITQLDEDMSEMEDDYEGNDEQNREDDGPNSEDNEPDPWIPKPELVPGRTSTKRKAVATHIGKTSAPAGSAILTKPISRIYTPKHVLPSAGKDNQYQCPLCSKIFGFKANLSVHMFTHTGERPHKCPTCSKGFTTVGNLNAHIRAHTGERPHKCQVCGKGFSTAGNLKQHMGSQHTSP